MPMRSPMRPKQIKLLLLVFAEQLSGGRRLLVIGLDGMCHGLDAG
jgi:hypothetical protein